jgi:ribonuclease D
MAALLDATARAHQLSPIALGTRRDLQRLVLGSKDVALLHGWRYEIIGRPLRALLEGHALPLADA